MARLRYAAKVHHSKYGNNSHMAALLFCQHIIISARIMSHIVINHPNAKYFKFALKNNSVHAKLKASWV